MLVWRSRRSSRSGGRDPFARRGVRPTRSWAGPARSALARATLARGTGLGMTCTGTRKRALDPLRDRLGLHDDGARQGIGQPPREFVHRAKPGPVRLVALGDDDRQPRPRDAAKAPTTLASVMKATTASGRSSFSVERSLEMRARLVESLSVQSARDIGGREPSHRQFAHASGKNGSAPSSSKVRSVTSCPCPAQSLHKRLATRSAPPGQDWE